MRQATYLYGETSDLNLNSAIALRSTLPCTQSASGEPKFSTWVKSPRRGDQFLFGSERGGGLPIWNATFSVG